jgi:alpha-L-fucosidase
MKKYGPAVMAMLFVLSVSAQSNKAERPAKTAGKADTTATAAMTAAAGNAGTTATKVSAPLRYGAQSFGKRTDPAMVKWRSNRFGQFIHWGLYSIPGGVWNGKTYAYAAEFLKSSAHVSDAAWDSLMYQFNPVKFDARGWAKMDKAMGVKYMTITTKHHEGFCMWPSQYTDFSIAHSPCRRDLLRELIDAYTAEGIDVNFYYSVLDWHHPDWRYDVKTPEDSIAFSRYLDYAKNQLKELATRYPEVKGFWFDGTWDNSVKRNGKWTLEVENMLKQLIPGCIVNSRLRADDLGKRHRDSNGDLMGDYESGFERRLPSPYDTSVTRNDWEACMTIPENQWGYHRDWSLSHVKSANEIIEDIVRTTALGGNILVNFGPKGDGSFRSEELQLAGQIGDWMKINGQAIYGCDYAGFERQDWGYFTKQTTSGKVYLVVCNVPVSRQLRIKLPSGKAISALNMPEWPGTTLTTTETGEQEYFINIPQRDYIRPFVIELATGIKGTKKKGSYQAAKT